MDAVPCAKLNVQGEGEGHVVASSRIAYQMDGRDDLTNEIKEWVRPRMNRSDELRGRRYLEHLIGSLRA